MVGKVKATKKGVANVSAGPPRLDYLASITTGDGVFEHARYDRPRVELGYCTDDAGRLLALACRLAHDPVAHRLARGALRYLERAHLGGGAFRLRLQVDGRWSDGDVSDDANGRALLGLGTAAARAPWTEVRERATAFGVSKNWYVAFRSRTFPVSNAPRMALAFSALSNT